MIQFRTTTFEPATLRFIGDTLTISLELTVMPEDRIKLPVTIDRVEWRLPQIKTEDG